MVDRIQLIGADDVERAGRNISGAADTISRAAETIDRASDFLSRRLDEETTRFCAALAEHDAERPTLRDYFAASALPEATAREMGPAGQYKHFSEAACRAIATDAFLMADAMLEARRA